VKRSWRRLEAAGGVAVWFAAGHLGRAAFRARPGRPGNVNGAFPGTAPPCSRHRRGLRSGPMALPRRPDPHT
jgi:hypothetical protein